MAGRNVKRGLVYFRLDCDIFQDRKVKRLMRRWQNDGLAVYLAILCEIYRDKGYYVTADEDLIADIADTCLLEEDRTTAIYHDCIALGLFDRRLLDEQKILSSKGIQARYLDIMTVLRRKGGIDAELSLISSEEIANESERIEETSEKCNNSTGERDNNAQQSQLIRNNTASATNTSEETIIISDKRKEEDRKEDNTPKTDIHTHDKRKGVVGENQQDHDRMAQATFEREWNKLARHEKMYLWVQSNYPIMLQFERPLSLDDCRWITNKIPDWHDIERLMENITNRRDVLSTHTSALATFKSFARMDVLLSQKQKI